MVQTWKQNSWPMYYQFKHRIISHISRAISKTPFNFCTDRKSQHPPLHQRPEKHRGSQKFHPLLRSSQNRVVTPWEKLTAYILLLNIKVQQVLWTQSSLTLCSLSEQKGWCWDFRGCVIVHQSKPACVTGVTQCFFLWLSRLWSHHTGCCGTRETSPVQPRAETLPWTLLRMNGRLPCKSEGVLCSVFLHPHHRAQELLVLLLIFTKPQYCGNSSLSRLHINCAGQQMGFSSLLRKVNLFICSSVLLLN